MAIISSIELPGGVSYDLNSPYLMDVVTPSFSSLPQTFYSEYLVAGHKVMGNAVYLSEPEAGDDDWTITCSDGSLTITGTFHGSTATTATFSVYLPKRTITLTSS